MDGEFEQAQAELQARFDELPQEIMSVMTDGTLDAVTFGIQNAFSLTDDQVRLLENEIIFVLAFFADRSEFARNVAESLGVDAEIAEAIGQEVESEVFDLVRDYFDVVETARSEGEVPGTPQDQDPKKASLRALADTIGKREESQGAPTPAPQRVVEELRTMGKDVNRVHGYGAGIEEVETPK